MTSSIRDLKVYTTYPHSCSYLEDKEATTLFVDPRQDVDKRLYSRLSVLGFRRSGSHIYRPHCAHCTACVPARIPVQQFKMKRSQRRIWNKNKDLRVVETDSIADDDAFNLYHRYICLRHSDGDMYPPDRSQYEAFLAGVWECTRYFRFFEGGNLVAIAVVDELEDGLSAIYTFFEPDLDKRSLGVYAILWQVEKTKELGLQNLYLGYWIRECQKMAYKSEYRPLELYVSSRWSPML
ncbi:MAG: arginyltransferase [Halioglobus sp.]